MTTDHPVITPKKLIEVALPLDAINAAAAKEKGNPFLKGHPRNLHQWWARRPLAAARAVLFSQLVHDPESLWRAQNPGVEPNKQVRGHWTKARARLFKIIEDLVPWENTGDTAVFSVAQEAIQLSWAATCELNAEHPQAGDLFNPAILPPVLDPFAGGGAIPVEAQRLSFVTLAGDLNPVAVLINKLLVESPPKFKDIAPVNPAWQALPREQKAMQRWEQSAGMASDLRYYGKQILDSVSKAIGQVYPCVHITKTEASSRPDLKHMEGRELPVLSWVWARTVKSPNPAYAHTHIPLASTFLLCNKPGKQSYVFPHLTAEGYTFTVRCGEAPNDAKGGTSLGKQKGFRCLMSGSPVSYEYIREEALAGRMGQKLMAIVAEGDKSRIYLTPNLEHEEIAALKQPTWRPELSLPDQALGFRVQLYGMRRFSDLFTQRQLVALTTFSDAIRGIRNEIHEAALRAGLSADDKPLEDGGSGARAYADSLIALLAMALDKTADYSNTICSWNVTNQNVGHLFTKQAIPMAWDFAEMNPLAGSLPFDAICEGLARSIELLPAQSRGSAFIADCGDPQSLPSGAFISTDPPYYNNIGYADLADFFYVWLRPTLRDSFPHLFSTLATPKTTELIASQFRHGGEERAEKFFLDGMTRAMENLSAKAHPAAPITIYYAFKQSETGEAQETSSTGWETFLEAVLSAGLAITGTWPMRTERLQRSIGQGTNSLASSIILVCRLRRITAETISRRQFIRELNATLPQALDAMTRKSEGEHSPVAPVDLSQAIIGPGMAVFSKYAAVLEADGSPMTVRTALQLINRFLAEDDFDADTQFCLHWFEQHGWESGKFGEADTLARAKGTSVEGVKNSGVLQSAGGNVRLLKWADYKPDWDPAADDRLPVWEGLHQLVRVFKTDGESAAGKVLAAVAAKAEPIRQLAYRLYTLCERAGRAEDARAYNELITSWAPIESAAAQTPSTAPAQKTLFE